MSVINTMLQDIERRNGANTSAESQPDVLDGLSAAHYSQENKRNTQPAIIILSTSVAISLVLASIYLLSSDRILPTLDNSSIVEAARVDTKHLARETASQITTTTTTEEDTVVTNVVVAKPAQAQANIAQIKSIPEKSIPENNKAIVVAKTIESAPVKTPAQKRKPVKTVAAEVSMKSNVPNNNAISKKQRPLSKREQAITYYHRGLADYEKSHMPSAVSLFQRALQADPSYKDPAQALATIHLANGDPEDAYKTVVDSLVYQSTDKDLLYLQFQAHINMGNIDSAIQVMENKIIPNSANEIGYLAGLYQKINNHDRAAELYLNALGGSPRQSVWWMGLAMSYEQLGNIKDALSAFKQAFSTGHLNTNLQRFVAQRIKILETGKKAEA